MNRDDHVSQKSLFAALRFLEWQERIRSYFQPAEGADRTSQLVAEAVKEFKRLPGMEGNWRELCRDNNWFRKFGAVLKSTKKMLEDEGVLVYDKKKGRIACTFLATDAEHMDFWEGGFLDVYQALGDF